MPGAGSGQEPLGGPRGWTCSPSQGSTLHRAALAAWGKARGHGHHSGSQRPPTRRWEAGLGSGREEQESAEEGAGAPGTGTGAPGAGDVTAARGRGAPAADPQGRGGAGHRAQLANSPPLSLPQERGTGTRCATPEHSWGTSSRPAPPPLPSPPATPPGPAPTCLPCDSPAGRPAAGGWESGLAGRRAGGGRWATRPRTWRTRLGRHSLPGGRGRKERQRRAPGRGARGREVPAVPTSPKRCAAQGTVLPCSSLGRALLRAPAGWRRSAPPGVLLSPLPHTPTGTVGAAAPPAPSRACGRDPGGACPAPAQRPSSAQRPAVRPLAAGRAPCTQAASHHSKDAAAGHYPGGPSPRRS